MRAREDREDTYDSTSDEEEGREHEMITSSEREHDVGGRSSEPSCIKRCFRRTQAWLKWPFKSWHHFGMCVLIFLIVAFLIFAGSVLFYVIRGYKTPQTRWQRGVNRHRVGQRNPRPAPPPKRPAWVEFDDQWKVRSAGPTVSAAPGPTLQVPPVDAVAPMALRNAQTATFVTASNQHYYQSLLNLIGSIHRHAGAHRIVVYDLGMDDISLRNLQQIWRVYVVPQNVWQDHAVATVGADMAKKPAKAGGTPLEQMDPHLKAVLYAQYGVSPADDEEEEEKDDPNDIAIHLNQWQTEKFQRMLRRESAKAFGNPMAQYLSRTRGETGPGKLPHHVRDVKSFAFKPIIMLDAMTRLKVGAMIYLDAGLEVNRDPSEFISVLEKQGYVYVAQEGTKTQGMCCGPVAELTNKHTFDYLGEKKEDWTEKFMCAGGIQGYRDLLPGELATHQNAVELVLKPVVECAWVEGCIAPWGSSVGDHRQDQSIFSIYVNKAGLNIDKRFIFWGNGANSRSYQTIQELNLHTISRRRDGIYRPYVDKMIRKIQLALIIPYGEESMEEMEALIQQINIQTPCKLPRAPPSSSGSSGSEFTSPLIKVDLLFYQSHTNDELQSRIFQLWNDTLSPEARRCFTDLIFINAGLQGEKDLAEPTRSTLLFHHLWRHPKLDLQKKGYSHFFYLETDVQPVRPYWLDGMLDLIRERNPGWAQKLLTHARGSGTSEAMVENEPLTAFDRPSLLYAASDWWQIGTQFRGFKNPRDDALNTRIDKNALYHLSHTYLQFLGTMWNVYPTWPENKSLGPDLDQARFLLEGKNGWMDDEGSQRQSMWSQFNWKYQLTEFIQDCHDTGCGHRTPFLIDGMNTMLVRQMNKVYVPPPSSPDAAGGGGGTTVVTVSAAEQAKNFLQANPIVTVCIVLVVLILGVIRAIQSGRNVTKGMAAQSQTHHPSNS